MINSQHAKYRRKVSKDYGREKKEQGEKLEKKFLSQEIEIFTGASRIRFR